MFMCSFVYYDIFDISGPDYTNVMAHINLYLYEPQQASAPYPFTSIDTSVHADVDGGQGLT